MLEHCYCWQLHSLLGGLLHSFFTCFCRGLRKPQMLAHKPEKLAHVVCVPCVVLCCAVLHCGGSPFHWLRYQTQEISNFMSCMHQEPNCWMSGHAWPQTSQLDLEVLPFMAFNSEYFNSKGLSEIMVGTRWAIICPACMHSCWWAPASPGQCW